MSSGVRHLRTPELWCGERKAPCAVAHLPLQYIYRFSMFRSRCGGIMKKRKEREADEKTDNGADAFRAASGRLRGKACPDGTCGSGNDPKHTGRAYSFCDHPGGSCDSWGNAPASKRRCPAAASAQPGCSDGIRISAARLLRKPGGFLHNRKGRGGKWTENTADKRRGFIK